jgi:glucuronoarabinoxylan endo-1,4-beta-xylanase
MIFNKKIILSIAIILFLCVNNLIAQETVINVYHNIKHQKIEGFGAALAFYENWLIAHPNKNVIYEAVFGELGLDILRVRNAHDYDAGMIGRVKEFIDASEKVNGSPIPFLSTSWGPPAYLKSNNDKSNGGTLKYSVSENGDVIFDYEGFANWWN